MRAASLPPDPSAGFAQRSAALLGRRLVRCEERYPEEGAHSVLLVVVKRDARTLAQPLEALHQEFFPREETDPLAPVELRVIDESTYEALQQLAKAGLIRDTSRAIRPFEPSPEAEGEELTPEEKKQVTELRSKAGRKIKIARLLSGEELAEEAREALLAALPVLGRALAIERRLPSAPEDLRESFGGPWRHSWGRALGRLRDFVEGQDVSVAGALDALEQANCL